MSDGDVLTSESRSHGEVVLLDPQQLLGFDQQGLGAVLLFQLVVDASRCERERETRSGIKSMRRNLRKHERELFSTPTAILLQLII